MALILSLIMDWDPGLFVVLVNGPHQSRVMKGDDSFSRVDRVQTRRYQRRSFCAREGEGGEGTMRSAATGQTAQHCIAHLFRLEAAAMRSLILDNRKNGRSLP